MFEIIGYEKIRFTNQVSGELIEGYKLYLMGESLFRDNSSGHSVLTKFFTSKSIQGEVKVGAFCEFKVSFNSKGEPKIIGCTIS